MKLNCKRSLRPSARTRSGREQGQTGGYFKVLSGISAKLATESIPKYQGLADREWMITADRAHKFLLSSIKCLVYFQCNRNSPDPAIFFATVHSGACPLLADPRSGVDVVRYSLVLLEELVAVS